MSETTPQNALPPPPADEPIPGTMAHMKASVAGMSAADATTRLEQLRAIVNDPNAQPPDVRRARAEMLEIGQQGRLTPDTKAEVDPYAGFTAAVLPPIEGIERGEQEAAFKQGLDFFRALEVPPEWARHAIEGAKNAGRLDPVKEERGMRARSGANFDRHFAAVRQVIDSTPGLGEYLERTGLGNSSHVYGALLNVAQRRGLV